MLGIAAKCLQFSKPILAGVMLLMAFSGCGVGWATGDYKPYVGEQENWPVGKGAYSDSNTALPTFYGFPPYPYEVMGYLDATTAPSRRFYRIEFAAKRAKDIGADAIIVLNKDGPNQELANAFNIHLDPESSSGDFFGKARVILVRWKARAGIGQTPHGS